MNKESKAPLFMGRESPYEQADLVWWLPKTDGAPDGWFELGAMVKWTSQAGGCTVAEVGEVQELVPAGSYPDQERFRPLYKTAATPSGARSP